MIDFDIKNRFTGKTQATAKINCGKDEKRSVKLRLVTEWAIKARADLSGADLSGADLSKADLRWADLSKADLRWANLILCGARSDGYRFYAHLKGGTIWIKAGCRHFSIKDASAHWKKTRGGTKLGDESLAMLSLARKLVKIRGLK